MQSGIHLRGTWLDVADEVLSIQGRLSDHVLECIREGKNLDIHNAPVPAINYFFAQSVFISLRTRVNPCQTSADLNVQLEELVSAQTMMRLVSDFIAAPETKALMVETQKSKQPITKEFLLKHIKTGVVESFVRLYYALEKAAYEVKQLHALSTRNESFSPEEFAAAVTDQLRNCKDVLSHLTTDELQTVQKTKVEPLIEFNNHLIRVLEEKKVCQIVVQDLLSLPMNTDVNRDASLVRKYPEFSQICSLQQVGEMLAGFAKNQAPGEEWRQAKESYAVALRTLENHIKGQLLVQSRNEVELFQTELAKMSKQKVDMTHALKLDTFGERLMQFNDVTDVLSFMKLADDLSHHCKALQPEASVVSKLTAKIDVLASKLPGKRTSQKEPMVDPILKSIEHFLLKADAAKKPYEDMLAKYEIVKKLRQEQDKFSEAQALLIHWQNANGQAAFIVDTALSKLREMSERLQDVEKQQPNMVLDFLKRRWPEMTISFGSVGTAGGFGSVLLSIFGIFTMPVFVTVGVVVIAGAATGVIVGAVKDIVTNPKSEKELAIASLNTLANGEVQRVEQPPAPPVSDGLFARFFGRSSPAPAVRPVVSGPNNNNVSL